MFADEYQPFHHFVHKPSQSSNNKRSTLSERETKEILENIHSGSIKLSVNLPELSITDLQFIQIVNAACHVKDQFSLHFSGNEITSAGIKHLVSLLQSNNTIVAIDLSHNRIDEVGAMCFFEILKSNFTITSLNLFKNFISEGTLTKLAKMIARNQSIQEEVTREIQKFNYYVELYTVIDCLMIPMVLTDIIQQYCQDVSTEEARNMLPLDFYTNAKIKAKTQYPKMHFGYSMISSNSQGAEQFQCESLVKHDQSLLHLSVEKTEEIVAKSEMEQRVVLFSDNYSQTKQRESYQSKSKKTSTNCLIL